MFDHDTFKYRMKQVVLPSKQLNLMQHLEVVQYSIVKYRAMKLRSSYLILNHVLYLKKVVLLLGSNMPRLKNTRLACLSAKESALFMWKRQEQLACTSDEKLLSRFIMHICLHVKVLFLILFLLIGSFCSIVTQPWWYFCSWYWVKNFSI